MVSPLGRWVEDGQNTGVAGGREDRGEGGGGHAGVHTDGIMCAWHTPQ